MTQTTLEKLKEYFISPGTIAKWWYPEERAGKYKECYIQQRIYVIREVEPRDKTVLDVGTGKGRFAISFIKNKAQEVVAVDISREMLNIAKEKINDTKVVSNISFLICDAEYLPFKSEIFNIVCYMQTFPHLSNPHKAMINFVYVLKNGGILAADAIVYRILYRILYRLYFYKKFAYLRYLAHKFFGKQQQKLEYH